MRLPILKLAILCLCLPFFGCAVSNKDSGAKEADRLSGFILGDSQRVYLYRKQPSKCFTLTFTRTEWNANIHLWTAAFDDNLSAFNPVYLGRPKKICGFEISMEVSVADKVLKSYWEASLIRRLSGAGGEASSVSGGESGSHIEPLSAGYVHDDEGQLVYSGPGVFCYTVKFTRTEWDVGFYLGVVVDGEMRTNLEVGESTDVCGKRIGVHGKRRPSRTHKSFWEAVETPR
jgi:hypothetical protein